MKHLRDVRIVIFEPERPVRNAMRGIMRDLGFAEIHDTDRPERLADALATGAVDLLVGDVFAAAGEMNATNRAIRRHEIGQNPFILSIGVTHEAEQQRIAETINAGHDDIMLKPLDLIRLRRRLEFFLRARMPFVVTSDYVGPDRRKESRPTQNRELQMIVPNPVRLIAYGMPRDLMMWHVRDAGAELDERKLRRDVNAVCKIADNIRLACEMDDGLDEAERLIRKLAPLAAEIDGRLTRTAFAQVRDLCDTLVDISKRIEVAAAAPGHVDVELLKNVAKAIKRGCDTDADDAIHVRGITEPVRAKALSPEAVRDAKAPCRQTAAA